MSYLGIFTMLMLWEGCVFHRNYYNQMTHRSTFTRGKSRINTRVPNFYIMFLNRLDMKVNYCCWYSSLHQR